MGLKGAEASGPPQAQSAKRAKKTKNGVAVTGAAILEPIRGQAGGPASGRLKSAICLSSPVDPTSHRQPFWAITSLPCWSQSAQVLRQSGEGAVELREMVNHAAEQLEAESRRLLPLLPTLTTIDWVESDS